MAKYDIKIICADVDGTLIEGGDITNYPKELKSAIMKARRNGVLFSMASGRDYNFMKHLWNDLTGSAQLRSGEAILYEDACIFYNGENHVLGGLNSETIGLVKKIETDNIWAFEGLVELPGNKFTIRSSRVTQEFANGKKTEGDILEKLRDRYLKIKEVIDSLKDFHLKLSKIESDFHNEN